MILTEPMTVITDFLLASFAVFFAYRLYRRRIKSASIKYWSFVMSFIAGAAVLAGFFHGFNHSWPLVIITILDYSSTICMLFVAYYIAVGTAMVYVRQKFLAWVKTVSVIATVSLFGVSLIKSDFIYIIIGYGSALAFITVLSIYKWRLKSSPWFVLGTVISIFGAMVQMSDIQIASIFNHNDIYHLIQIIALYIFYRGALLLDKKFVV